MTIDEAITWLNTDDYESKGFADATSVAIETMRKYQKIQKIVSDFREYQKGISCGFGGATYMQMVSEVLEDGND